MSGVWTKASHFYNAQAATGLCNLHNTSLHDDDDDDDDTHSIKAFVDSEQLWTLLTMQLYIVFFSVEFLFMLLILLLVKL